MPMRAQAVEDAVFEVVGKAGRDRARVNDNPPRPPVAEGQDATEFLARLGVGLARKAETVLNRLSPQSFATLSCSVFMLVFWLLGGFSAFSAPSSPVGPLAVSDVTSVTEDANGMKILAITGRLSNNGSQTLAIPRLRIVSESSGQTIGLVDIARGELGANGSLRFSARLNLAGGKSGQIAIFPEVP
jgi:hypothetical protein